MGVASRDQMKSDCEIGTAKYQIIFCRRPLTRDGKLDKIVYRKKAETEIIVKFAADFQKPRVKPWWFLYPELRDRTLHCVPF